MVALGASVLIVALLSTALVPLLGGSVGARAGYTPLETVPAASRGVFFGADGAFVRPYPWHVAPSDYPPDSLTIRDVETILVQEKRAGDATDYRLVDLTDAHRYPLAEVSRARVGKLDQLVMAPREPLPAGRYLLIADQTASMYGGTVEYFFSVDAATAPLSERLPEPPREAPSASAAPAPPAGAATPAAEEPAAGEPAPGADRLWSGLAALSAVLLAGFVWLDYRRKPAPHRMWWALGVTMFAVASSMGLLHALRGAWEPLPYRLWYLAGALLAAAFLGHGTAWLVLPRRVAKALTWILVLYTGAATALALAAPLALANLGPGDQLSGRALPEIAGALAATPRFHTIFLNSYGAAFLVLGALWSAWRMRGKPELLYRVWGTISIAAGGMAMGAVGTLNRFGFSGAQSLGEVVAIALIFAGFKLAAMQREVPATRRGSEASPRYAVAGRGTNP